MKFKFPILNAIILILFIIAEIYMFIKIDSSSHSVSDTLINFVPFTIILFLIFFSMFYLLGKKR